VASNAYCKLAAIQQGMLDELRNYQTQATVSGPMLSYSLDGVSVDWLAYQAGMMQKIRDIGELLDDQRRRDSETCPFEIRSDFGS
jgi:hypothetical protein